MKEKIETGTCKKSPNVDASGSLTQDSGVRGSEDENQDEPSSNDTSKRQEETDKPPTGTGIHNGDAKGTAYAHHLKKEVPVIELTRRDDIKGRNHWTEQHKVQTTELCRPPISLPLPHRDVTNDTRMVQLSPTAFPLPARAMLYNNVTQSLATINRWVNVLARLQGTKSFASQNKSIMQAALDSKYISSHEIAVKYNMHVEEETML